MKLGRFLVILLTLTFSQNGSTQGSLPGSEQTISQIDLGSAKVVDSSWYGTKYVMAPILVPLDVYRRIKQEDPKDEVLKDQAKYFAGYIVFVLVAERVAEHFFLHTVGDFRSAIETESRPNPKRLLVLSSRELEEPDRRLVKRLRELYRGRVKHIIADTLEDLRKQLLKLPQNSQYDRIELSGHGAPGKVFFNEKPITRDNVATIFGDLKLAAPNAQLRVLSCDAGSNTWTSRVGDELGEALGRTLLTHGGKVFLSPKVMDTSLGRTHRYPEILFGFTNGRGLVHLPFLAFDLKTPIALAVDLASSPVKQKLFDVKVVEIPDPTNCSSKVLIRYLKAPKPH